MTVTQNIQAILQNKQVRCPNCGTINPAENTNCEDCESLLIAKAPMWANVYEVLFAPVRGMCRVAATMPVMQGFLIVLLLGALSALQSVFFIFLQYSFLADNAAIRTPQLNAELTKLSPPPSFLPNTLTTIAFAIISWFMFAATLFIVARLLYRNQPTFKNNFWSMLAVVGFGRLAELLVMLYTLVGFFYPDLFSIGSKITALKLPGTDPNTTISAFTQVIPDNVVFTVIEAVANIGTLVWKILLISLGVHYVTGVTWNRALLITVIPALLFIFVLRIPF
jgi:Yip1 domain